MKWRWEIACLKCHAKACVKKVEQKSLDNIYCYQAWNFFYTGEKPLHLYVLLIMYNQEGMRNNPNLPMEIQRRSM